MEGGHEPPPSILNSILFLILLSSCPHQRLGLLSVHSCFDSYTVMPRVTPPQGPRHVPKFKPYPTPPAMCFGEVQIPEDLRSFQYRSFALRIWLANELRKRRLRTSNGVLIPLESEVDGKTGRVYALGTTRQRAIKPRGESHPILERLL